MFLRYKYRYNGCCQCNEFILFLIAWEIIRYNMYRAPMNIVDPNWLSGNPFLTGVKLCDISLKTENMYICTVDIVKDSIVNSIEQFLCLNMVENMK